MLRDALYDGWCRVCGGRIRQGSRIEWSKAEGARHVNCAEAGAPAAGHAAPETAPGPISLSGGSGYGCEGWEVGQIILSGEKRRRAGGPDAMVVVTASRRYVREDGLSFGVGEESGYVYSATARPATAEEVAAAIEGAHEEALAVERGLEAERIERLFLDAGTYPDPGDGQVVLAGEEIPVETRNRIYGSGVWAVIEPEGPREAPLASELQGARDELAARRAALAAARERLVAWTAEHLPASAPARHANAGRPPHDGVLYSKDDLACLSAGDRPVYDALRAEVQRLSYTSSADSYHAAEKRVRDLEQAAHLATYPRSIWWVVNNGADGDDWSRSNVRTGGAGAVGRRLAWSSELDRRVRAVRER